MQQKEIEHMQVRLFQYACNKWGIGIQRSAELFDFFQVDQYIEEMYEFFHVQGDMTNLEEIEQYLRSKGVEI